MNRLKKLRDVMAAEKYDAILITDSYNRRYFSGFTGTTGTLLVLKDRAIFMTDFRYMEQASAEVIQYGFEVLEVNHKNPAVNVIAEILGDKKLTKMAVEDNSMTIAQFNGYKSKLENVELLFAGDKISNLRMKKEEDEIEIMRKAAEIADQAFSTIISKIKIGMTEKEIADNLEYIMKQQGATSTSFETIVASGYRSAMPHGVASTKVIKEEEFIKIDFGCVYNGYCSDITRTLYIGNNISDKHFEIYHIVKEAQHLAISAAKAGITGKELDAIAREFIASKGYGDNFGHGLGHGLGIEVHENPTLSYRGDTVLEEGMVVTIEPGIYIEGFGGVRIEDDIVIRENGCEILNKTTKELIILIP